MILDCDSVGFAVNFLIGTSRASAGQVLVRVKAVRGKVEIDPHDALSREADSLVATINVASIGLEPSPDGKVIFAATANNLRSINLATNAVSNPLLTGGSVMLLNFFNCPAAFAATAQQVVFVGGNSHFGLRFSVDKAAVGGVTTVELSEDLAAWWNAATYTASGIQITRDSATQTVQHSIVDDGGIITVVERDADPIGAVPKRFYRLRRE